ncbi:urease accessory protein UreD [Rhodobacteraceae bacterium CCMM004]|nr:urease accessory protein UreD [Rhodobacteraceae bacterium CCMM004]
MFDDTSSLTLERARGRAAVRLSRRGLVDLAQSGAAKAMLPRMHGAAPEVVFLNTAGGITGGDRLTFSVALEAGARATATTQTAERAYAALPGAPGRVDVRLDLAPGAALDWLPQETILFDRADLERRTVAMLRGDARLLMAETVVLGRRAMGETVARLRFADRRRVTRDGRPVLVEGLALDDAVLAAADNPATLAGARALGLIALVAPGAEAAAEALRRLPGADGVRWAVSGWDGKCVVRLMAADAQPLRRLAAALLTHLRGGPLPRVWTM